jgi:catechol 2,3-dioxygenase-like lactoylglutathione lyase family enzyme
MAVQFNHTIVSSRDQRASAAFLAEMLGLSEPTRWGPFHVVRTANDANIDFMNSDNEIAPQHYAFLVDEKEFDGIFTRVRGRGLQYWADPAQTKEGEINHHDGGRGVYFEDPNGHLLEVITRPYGSGGWNP